MDSKRPPKEIWFQYFDDEGTSYYYNSRTKRTSWTNPGSSIPAPRALETYQPTQQTIDEVASYAEYDDESDDSQEQEFYVDDGIDDPPPFWTVHFTAQGPPFFLNIRTNKATFNPPPCFRNPQKIEVYSPVEYYGHYEPPRLGKTSSDGRLRGFTHVKSTSAYSGTTVDSPSISPQLQSPSDSPNPRRRRHRKKLVRRTNTNQDFVQHDPNFLDMMRQRGRTAGSLERKNNPNLPPISRSPNRDPKQFPAHIKANSTANRRLFDGYNNEVDEDEESVNIDEDRSIRIHESSPSASSRNGTETFTTHLARLATQERDVRIRLEELIEEQKQADPITAAKLAGQIEEMQEKLVVIQGMLERLERSPSGTSLSKSSNPSHKPSTHSAGLDLLVFNTLEPRSPQQLRQDSVTPPTVEDLQVSPEPSPLRKARPPQIAIEPKPNTGVVKVDDEIKIPVSPESRNRNDSLVYTPGSSKIEAPPASIKTPRPSLPNDVPMEVPQSGWKFQKGRLLGKGGYAKVYDAIRLPDAFPFALKQIELESIDEERLNKQKAELHKEVRIMSRLNHPNCLKYYGSHEQEEYLWIYLEKAQKSLQALLAEFHKLDEKVVVKYTRQLLEGLAYLHKKNVIHRDIKGANILIGTDDKLKLADFGASKIVENLLFSDGQFHSMVGTPFWMAPEIVKYKTYDSRCDIWSLGCVVVEMFTGKHPYGDLNAFAALNRIGKGVLPDVPVNEMSAGALRFVTRCLQIDPTLRPSAQELLNDPWVCGDADGELKIPADIKMLPKPKRPRKSVPNMPRKPRGSRSNRNSYFLSPSHHARNASDHMNSDANSLATSLEMSVTDATEDSTANTQIIHDLLSPPVPAQIQPRSRIGSMISMAVYENDNDDDDMLTELQLDSSTPQITPVNSGSFFQEFGSDVELIEWNTEYRRVVASPSPTRSPHAKSVVYDH